MLSTTRRAERPEPAAAGADPTAVRPVVREPLTPPTPRGPVVKTSAAQPGRPESTRVHMAVETSSDRREGVRVSIATPVAPGLRIARWVVGGALALFFVTVTVIVATATRGDPRADIQAYEQRLAGYDQDVRSQLARLGPPGSVARARLRTRGALAATEALARQLRELRGTDAARLRAATTAQRRYLDAVGSTLTNPRSPLRGQLPARAVAAKKALAGLDPPALRAAH